jgi:hypothetical protein
MAVSPIDHPYITVVSGLPRSGTSMMMAMLQAGGIAPLSDGVRAADEDNPRGYFELEPVKELALDDSWLDAAAGKSIKIISALLERLPTRYDYRVVFMQRDLREVLASQRAMLGRRGRGAEQPDDERMAALFEKHLAKVRDDIAARAEMKVLYLDHATVIKDPASAAALVNEFVGGICDVAAMADAVEGGLYRQRRIR